MSATTLVVTNDFPPRIGGIENFVRAVCGALDDDVVVLTSREPGAGPYDGSLPFEVVRAGRVLLPTPATARLARDLLRRYAARRVLFGAAAPLGLLARSLRQAGADHLVGLTHGHETWWARVPLARTALRRIGDDTDHLGVISGYTRSRIAPALSPRARDRLLAIPPPYDHSLFGPPAGDRRGTETAPRCVGVGRLVRRKGFDVLVRAWLLVQQAWPAEAPPPELLLVGDGPERRRLEALVRGLGLSASVRFVGPLPPAGVAHVLQQADVFAFPVRPRLGGLDCEGLGLAAVEAAACGVAVIVSRSGGAPDTVRDQVTGLVVEPGRPGDLAVAVSILLMDKRRSRAMGEAGREWAAEHFSVDRVRDAVRGALRLP